MFLSKIARMELFNFVSAATRDGVAASDPKRQLSCKAHLTMATGASSSVPHPVPPALPFCGLNPHINPCRHHRSILEHKKRKLVHGACNSKALLAACRSFIKIAAATNQQKKKGPGVAGAGAGAGAGASRRLRQSASKMA